MLGEISGDTTINLSLLLTLIGVFGTAIAGASVMLITQGLALTHLRRDIDLRAKQDQVFADRLKMLEEWRIRSDALDEASSAASSTTRGHSR